LLNQRNSIEDLIKDTKKLDKVTEETKKEFSQLADVLLSLDLDDLTINEIKELKAELEKGSLTAEEFAKKLKNLDTSLEGNQGKIINRLVGMTGDPEAVEDYINTANRNYEETKKLNGENEKLKTGYDKIGDSIKKAGEKQADWADKVVVAADAAMTIISVS
jgi:hypothetical protein